MGSFISVRTDVVMQVLVPSLHEAAAGRASGEGLEWLESMGAAARAVELERFAPARAAMPWLAEMLVGADPREVSRALADEEPLERPEPPDAPSWRVPGPGGHVRHFLARQAAHHCGLGWSPETKSAWMAGFFAACCAELGRVEGAAQDPPVRARTSAHHD